MPGYVIYLPQGRGCAPEQLDNVGLGVLRDGSIEFADCLQGPDGGFGNIAFWSRPNKPQVLEVDRFDWTPAVPDGDLAAARFFVGMPKDGLTPADIERKVAYPGYSVKMADGQKWDIPAASMLPHRHGLDKDGQHVRQITERFKDYWEKSQQYAAQFFQAIAELMEAQERAGIKQIELTREFTLADTWAFCVAALSINYRLNGDLVSLLELLDDESMANICKAACDLPVLIDVNRQKKTESVAIPVGLST